MCMRDRNPRPLVTTGHLLIDSVARKDLQTRIQGSQESSRGNYRRKTWHGEKSTLQSSGAQVRRPLDSNPSSTASRRTPRLCPICNMGAAPARTSRTSHGCQKDGVTRAMH